MIHQCQYISSQCCSRLFQFSIFILEIAVSDTGKEIPEDELPTIFDEYRQVKGSESSVQKGTGLGLSITRKFAELLGGRLRWKARLGKGRCLW